MTEGNSVKLEANITRDLETVPVPATWALTSLPVLAMAPATPMPWDLIPGFWGWAGLAITGATAMGIAARALRPRRKPRVSLRYRLKFRLHPGPGFAGRWELFWGYARGPARRIAKRSRPSLTWRDRRFGPAREYAVFLGWARPSLVIRRRAHATLKDVTLTIAPPQQGKSAAAAGRILDAPGAVVATSIRGDLIAMTAGVRQVHGMVHVFNPSGIGDFGSTFKWNLVAGCQDPEVAVRRAGYLVAGVRASAVSDANFWQDQAVLTLAGYLQAGGLTKVTLRTVHRWIVERDQTPLRVLEQHEGAYPESRLAVAEYLNLPDRTQASVSATIRNVLRFLAHPAAADALEPRSRGELFDIEQFLSGRDTLFLVANAESSELAPLFLCLVSELFQRAVLEGSRGHSGALDPPLSMVLDEVANICPIPVHSWATYAAGSGVVMHLIGQAWAHFRERWGDNGSEVIWQAATCKIFYTASSDTEMMERVSKLAGDIRMQVDTERVPDGRNEGGQAAYRTRAIFERVPVLPVADMRQMPPWHAVVILGSRKPTIVKVERGWKRADYKRWVKSGQAIMLPGVRTREVPVPRPELLIPQAPQADELTSRRSRREVPEGAPPLPLARPAEQGSRSTSQQWRPWDGPVQDEDGS